MPFGCQVIWDYTVPVYLREPSDDESQMPFGCQVIWDKLEAAKKAGARVT